MENQSGEKSQGGVVLGLDPQTNCYYYLYNGPYDGKFYAFKQENRPINYTEIDHQPPLPVPLQNLPHNKVENLTENVQNIKTECENETPDFETVLIVENHEQETSQPYLDEEFKIKPVKKLKIDKSKTVQSESAILEIICPICLPKKTFGNSVALTNHLNFAHLLTGIPDSSELEKRKAKEIKKEKCKPIKCPPAPPKKKFTNLPLKFTSSYERCPQTFQITNTSKWNFVNKEYYIIEDELENYICPKCNENKLFSTIEAAKNHLKFAHMNEDVESTVIMTLRDHLRTFLSESEMNPGVDYSVVTIGKADGTKERILTRAYLN